MTGSKKLAIRIHGWSGNARGLSCRRLRLSVKPPKRLKLREDLDRRGAEVPLPYQAPCKGNVTSRHGVHYLEVGKSTSQ